LPFTRRLSKPLGILHAADYDEKDGPEGHSDLKGFGRDSRVFFRPRQGNADARAAHIGFVVKLGRTDAEHFLTSGSGL
jgi:hypothetical protein